jgi:hypothetical protein
MLVHLKVLLDGAALLLKRLIVDFFKHLEPALLHFLANA